MQEHDGVCDSVDSDADRAVDEGYVSLEVSCGVGACAATGTTRCEVGAVADDCTPGVPAASDPSCDSVDDDCDGAMDEDFLIPGTGACGIGACQRSSYFDCVDGSAVEVCEPGEPDEEWCNGEDDDCDGQTDEDADTDSDTVCGVGACQAQAVELCVEGALVESCQPGVAAEQDVACNQVDDDCDGLTDEGPDADADGVADACDNCPTVQERLAAPDPLPENASVSFHCYPDPEAASCTSPLAPVASNHPTASGTTSPTLVW